MHATALLILGLCYVSSPHRCFDYQIHLGNPRWCNPSIPIVAEWLLVHPEVQLKSFWCGQTPKPRGVP